MSRTTLKPGDLLMVDPVLNNVQAAPVVVAENGTDLVFQFNPKAWHEQVIGGVQGLTVQEAEEVLRGEREYEGGVLYKVWEDETQTSYSIPESVIEEIERRQMAKPAKGEPAETQGSIKPAPLDFDNPPSTSLW